MVKEIDSFRSKYPEYSDINDIALADMLGKKYPDSYGDLRAKVGAELYTIGSPSDTQLKALEELNRRGSLISDIKEDIQQRQRRSTDIIERGVGRMKEAITEGPAGGLFQPVTIAEVGTEALKTGAQVAGQAAGATVDVVGDLLVSGFKALIPEETRQGMSNKLTEFTKTPAGQIGLSAMKGGAEQFKLFEERFPDEAAALGSILNISGLGIGKKVVTGTAKEALGIVEDVGEAVARARPGVIDKQLLKIIKKDMPEAIRPSVAGKRTAKQLARAEKQAQSAVETIIENKSVLQLTDNVGEVVEGLPKNLRQFSEAVGQTKKVLFEKFDGLLQQAGKEGATVDISKIGKELDAIINDNGLRATAPDIVKYAQDVKDNLIEVGKLSTQEAQTAIQALNKKMGAITDFNSAAKSYVDSIVVNNLRKSLDNVVETATGKEFQILKNKYGALTSIERDVARRTVVDARKNAKGLIDFTDVFTGAEAISGIVTMQPTAIARGVLGKTIATLIKLRNDPNRVVKKMFTRSEKLLKKRGELKQSFEPKSRTGKILNQ